MNNKNLLKLICISLILVTILLPSTSAWWGKWVFTIINFNDDHKELTDQALDEIDNNDTFNNYREIYDYYDNKLKSSSNNLDDHERIGNYPLNKEGYYNVSVSHFYNPNGSAYSNQWPSALDETKDWLDEAIAHYSKGEKDMAYTKLGYMTHLLEDMAVPAHSHLIFHGSGVMDYLESNVDADDIDTSSDAPIQAYNSKGNDIYAIEKQFNELARKSYNESDNQAIIDTYYAEGTYIGSNQACGFPLLGQTCSPTISSSDVNTLEQDLMPKAVQYSAGLAMRVYDIFKSLDWPFYHHDLRRTGFTLLKGDMDSDNKVKESSWTLDSDVSSAFYDYPSMADVDNDGQQEILTASSRIKGSASEWELRFNNLREMIL